ncbi:MAG: type II toxin-antitoxin system VapC family toxin [Thermoprotei archaeon]|nr:type II toxin-antitoxin system VapC family toxin [Thermoprotei archaeon]
MASKRVVVDASLIIDLYTAPDDMRASIAEEVLSWITTGLVEAYAPKLLMVEVLGVLARYLSDEDLELVMSSFPPIKLIPEEVFYDEAVRIARSTGSRVADAYYIAVASIINGILLTNDRRQKQNARKVGIETYYLIEEKEVAKQSILLSHNQHEEHK